jgi:hypothetical protein
VVGGHLQDVLRDGGPVVERLFPLDSHDGGGLGREERLPRPVRGPGSGDDFRRLRPCPGLAEDLNNIRT